MSTDVNDRSMNESWLTIPVITAAITDSSDSSSSSDDDDDSSDVEVMFTRDERPDDLVQINDLRLQSDDSDDDDDDEYALPNDSVATSPCDVSTPGAGASAEDLSESNLPSATKSGDNPSKKRKRRAWSVREKLRAIENYETSNSKHSTARVIGCTRFQLSEWIKQKDELKSLKSKTRGGRRKRLNGAGKKVMFPTLDEQLIGWFKERRTPPDSNATPSEIKRERISFKQLMRYGTNLSIELKHDKPSSKWYRRFLTRHGLSLQRPKRNQKIPLDEAHARATEFYNFLRRASTWGPKRGDMGAFTPRDVCNFDESPLSLFGDQTNRSLNYVNVDNEVENPVSSKRFATVILSVFPEDNDRVDPVLLFKGKGRISTQETNQYSKQVKVFFTPKAVINTETASKFVDYWHSKVKDSNPKLLITDSCNCHLKPVVKQSLRQKRVVLAVIPKGCTQYLQILDTLIFSTFKSHYFNAAEEFLEANGPRAKLKLNASQSRIICTRLTAEAWKRTLKAVDLKKGFHELGYTWTSHSVVTPRTLPGFVYDPDQAFEVQLIDDNDDDNENRIEKEACLANEIHTQTLLKISSKQLKLSEVWNKTK